MQVSLLITLLACIDRTIPDHLLAAPKIAHTQEEVPPSGDAHIAWYLGPDPLARAVREMAQPTNVSEHQTYAPFFEARKTVEQQGADAGMLMQIVEERGRGTANVPFSRGYRLKAVETSLSHQIQQHESQQHNLLLATLSTPLRPRPSPLNQTLAEQTTTLKSTDTSQGTLLSMMENWVLLGWLDGPNISLHNLGELLQQPQYGRFADHPTAKLIQSRAANHNALPIRGEDSLRHATLLELTRAAADNDSEIAAWAEKQRVERTKIGGIDPIHYYLTDALKNLTESAGDDSAMANALVAMAGLEWTGFADQHRFHALHRVDVLSAAKRFDTTNPMVNIWRTIALKEAIDTLDVGRNTSLFEDAVLNLIGVLISTGAGPFHVSVLTHETPSPELWLEIGRGMGAESTTDWERLRRDLGYLLRSQAKRARENISDPAFTKLLLKIESRA